jgi:hypothetical protein
MDDLIKQNSSKTADIKRLENGARKFILRRLCFTLITLKRF